MRLFLVRHGESPWNVEKRYTGHADVPLSPVGEQQGQQLAERLAPEPLDAIYSSDLQRAWRTAKFIGEGRGVPMVREATWREITYGAWEGLTGAEIKTQFPDDYRRWSADIAHQAPPGGETWLALQERALAAVRGLGQQHHERSVLVVTHSAFLWTLSCWLHGLPPVSPDAPRMSNGGLSCLLWEDPDPQVLFWNDVAHLGLIEP